MTMLSTPSVPDNISKIQTSKNTTGGILQAAYRVWVLWKYKAGTGGI